MLADAYAEAERIIQDSKEKLAGLAQESSRDEALEEKILLAEYAMDFAMLAADHAVAISMEAIASQMEQQEERSL